MIKRDKFKRLLAVVFWLLATAFGLGLVATGSHAATYYIGPNGDYTTFAAWKTAVPTPATGSDVYFECGGTYYPAGAWSLNWQGTAGDRLVLGSFYYSGGQRIIGLSGARPIISGQNYTYPTGTLPVGSGLINWVDKDYVTVQNIYITQSRGAGITISGSNFGGTSSTYFIVENCYIVSNYMQALSVIQCAYNYGILRNNFISENALAGNWALNLYPNHPGCFSIVNSPYANTTITGNVLLNNHGESISVYNYSDTLPAAHHGYVTITDNFDLGKGLIYVDGAEHIDILRNVIIRGNHYAGQTLGGVAFAWYGMSIHNEIYPDPGAAQHSGESIYNYQQTNTVNIQNNLIASCAGAISVGMEAYSDNIYNLFIDHNTMIANYRDLSVGAVYGSYTNCFSRNNAFWHPTGTVFDAAANENGARGVSGWTSSNNAGRGGSQVYGAGYVTLADASFATSMRAQWQQLTTLAAIQAVSVNEFKIALGNLVDAGLAIAAIEDDFFGTVRPAGSAYDIGAHEYNDYPNRPPVISAVTPGNITIYPNDLTQTFSCTATDTDGDDVTLVWDFTTSGAYATNSTSATPGSLAIIDPGTYPTTYTITITATDEFGLSNSYSFDIQIVADAEASSCQELYAPSFTADLNAAQFGAYNAQEFSGWIYQPAFNQSLCSVDVYVRGKTGSPTGILYLAVYEVDGSNQLATLVGISSGISASSGVAGTWISANAGMFNFDPAVTLTSGTKYGFGIFRDTDGNLNDDPETDSVNFLSIGADNENSGDTILWGIYKWSYGVGTLPFVIQTFDAEDDPLIKINTLQEQATDIVVNRVYASTTNGTYKEGDSIVLAVEFNLPVALTDANTNTTKDFTATATVGGQTFTATHSFPAFATEATTHYLTGTVPASSSGLLETITLNLNGDAMGTADLTIGAGKNVGSNSEIYFDTSAPAIASFYACDEDGVQITDTTLISTETSGYVCMESDGDSIFFANGPLGNLTLSLANIVPAVTARYLSGIGTSKLIFKWDSVAGNRGTDAAVAGTDAFDPTPTVLRDQAGNALTLTLPNTWLIDANELNFAVPKSLIYGAGWWVASDWDTEKPDPVVAGDYFVLGAGALDATETISESGITLNVVGNTTSAITISGDNNEIWYRQGSVLTITDNGTGNVVVKNCPECE